MGQGVAMIGVVLWSDPDGGKAVFWCEDQGDLAYYEDPIFAREGGEAFFDAGDMVRFDVTRESRQRRAHNPRLLEEQGYAGLPEKLRQTAAPDAGDTDNRSATIIPFRTETQPHHASGRVVKKA